ncbi:MAG TPA: hypothetical protein VKE70_37600 [Candidatus Solibacter sp.]|nr:hypothetical protein [Candidatus Solibacter sp.]
MPDTATIVLHAYNGKREMLANTDKWSAQTIDGRHNPGQAPLQFPNLKGASQALTVPFFDNFGDLYSVIASRKACEDSAWYPVHVSDATAVELYLMFLPKNGTLNFANATWDKLRPRLREIIRNGCENDQAASDKYGEIIEKRPKGLACMLNIMTALADIVLPSGKRPLDYYWNIGWPKGDPKQETWFKSLDDVLKPDRFFCYVERTMLQDVQNADGHGFAEEPNPQAWGHKHATESYKQTHFDVANVQLTFDHNDTATFTDAQRGLVNCIKIEPDIDYYKDVAAHALSEVIPNLITGHLTDPRVSYMLRWMAAKREGLPEFDPLFTVVPAV